MEVQYISVDARIKIYHRQGQPLNCILVDETATSLCGAAAIIVGHTGLCQGEELIHSFGVDGKALAANALCPHSHSTYT